MKERRERTMDDLLADMQVDEGIRERFRMERQPARSVDGDDPYERDLFEPPGMWEAADLFGGWADAEGA